MTINRSAMLQQIQSQLQSKLNDKADVLLINAGNIAIQQNKPQVTIKLIKEDVLFSEQNSDQKFGQKNNQILIPYSNQHDQRAMHIVLHTTAQADSAAELLTLLDEVAQSNELGLQNPEQLVLWQKAQPQNTEFTFVTEENVFKGIMTQLFKFYYFVVQEDETPQAPITQVYLGQEGEDYHLIATLNAGEAVNIPKIS